MRVIAGRLGGRTLRAPRGEATRPTADRVRQALFEVLGDLTGARVLDLYAGTGALGIEALSRGATHAVLVESARAAVEVIRENIARLGLATEATLVATRVERSETTLGRLGPFDLILCDPPWPELGRALPVVTALLPKLTLPGARWVLEHPARVAPPTAPEGWQPFDQRTYGDSAVALYVRSGVMDA